MEKKWIFLSGLLVGLAIGTRLSFALIIIPFLCLILLYPKVMHLPKKVGMFLSFCFGCFLAMLPTIFMFILAPKQFIFGNLRYAQLNTLYRKEMGFDIAMTLFGKFIYFIKYVIISPENLILIVAFTIIILMNFRNIRQKPSNHLKFILILVLIPFLLIGSLAPTPSWYQYFYAPVPFLVLGLLYGISSFYGQDTRPKWGFQLFALTVIISIIFGIDSYRHKNNLLSTRDWIPNKVHEIGIEIENALGKNKGKVLTLAPIYPLEGGVDIYEEFATGSFVWRVASLLSEDKRREFGMISEEDLNVFLRKNPPRAILVGFGKDLEKPLVGYAKDNGYKNLELSNGKTLWLSSF